MPRLFHSEPSEESVHNRIASNDSEDIEPNDAFTAIVESTRDQCILRVQAPRQVEHFEIHSEPSEEKNTDDKDEHEHRVVQVDLMEIAYTDTTNEMCANFSILPADTVFTHPHSAQMFNEIMRHNLERKRNKSGAGEATEHIAADSTVDFKHQGMNDDIAQTNTAHNDTTTDEQNNVPDASSQADFGSAETAETGGDDSRP